ncbi:MAG: hypothetical protein K0Q55_2672 [Verrucomicrobia bacterium]|jgi:hypothetical protein|nr:hypothetical protein [Verrucomicrobiota bacterium]
MGALCFAAQGAGTPKIHFDKMTIDFGKVSQVDTVTGVFKFKNTGDGILKIEAPKPSCGCTLAELKPDTLNPGESGELPFTMHLGQSKAIFDKHIAVKSNDPTTPEVTLSIKADYTPLYEINPLTLAPKLAFGVNDTAQFTTLTRHDGKPLKIAKVEVSQPWIKATVEPEAKKNASSANIRVAIQRDGAPRRFNEYVHVYVEGQTNKPVASIYVYGQIMGEISVTPEALYWSITDAPTGKEARPEATVVRKVTIRSADGKALALKNPASSMKGLKVELVKKDKGMVYELIARLDEVPAATVSGSISFETSVASEPKMTVPFVINVFKP